MFKTIISPDKYLQFSQKSIKIRHHICTIEIKWTRHQVPTTAITMKDKTERRFLPNTEASGDSWKNEPQSWERRFITKLSPPPSADEDAISTRQQWLQTHTHSAHRACRSWWGVGGGERVTYRTWCCRCRSMKVVAEVIVYISGRLNLSLISKWEKCMLGIWLILGTL